MFFLMALLGRLMLKESLHTHPARPGCKEMAIVNYNPLNKTTKKNKKIYAITNVPTNINPPGRSSTRAMENSEIQFWEL